MREGRVDLVQGNRMSEHRTTVASESLPPKARVYQRTEGRERGGQRQDNKTLQVYGFASTAYLSTVPIQLSKQRCQTDIRRSYHGFVSTKHGFASSTPSWDWRLVSVMRYLSFSELVRVLLFLQDAAKSRWCQHLKQAGGRKSHAKGYQKAT